MDLTQHLTTQLTTTMHHLSLCLEGKKLHSLEVKGCQDFGKVLALLELNHMPTACAGPFNRSFNLVVVPPGGVLNATLTALKGGKPSNTFLALISMVTTRVSNPVCYPRFASASVTDQRVAFATGVFSIYLLPPPHMEFHSPLLHLPQFPRPSG